MSLAHLPPAIVAAATALATDLARWAEAHPDSSLADAETAVLHCVRDRLPTLLGGVLQQTQRAWTSQPVRCPTCHHAAAARDWRPRQVLTRCGLLRWERPWARCARCAQAFGAGDTTVGALP